MLVEVLLKAGRFEQARLTLAAAVQAAEVAPGFVNQAFLRWGKARLAVAEGCWEQAMADYAQLSQALETHGFRLHLAQVLQEWSEAHLRRGEPGDSERARSLLASSIDLYEEIGIPDH